MIQIFVLLTLLQSTEREGACIIEGGYEAEIENSDEVGPYP